MSPVNRPFDRPEKLPAFHTNDIQVRNCCFVVLFLVRSYQWVLFQAQNHGTHGCSCCAKSTYCSTLELQVVRLYGPTSPRDETMLCTSRTLTDLNVSEQNPLIQQQLARPKLPLIGLIEKPTPNRSANGGTREGSFDSRGGGRWEGVKEYGARLGLKNTRWICLNVHRDDSCLQKLRLKLKMLLRIFEGVNAGNLLKEMTGTGASEISGWRNTVSPGSS